VKTYDVVTSSATMLASLLSKEDLLTFIPASIVRSGLEAGLLAELAWTQHSSFSPIGFLAPDRGHGPALANFTSYMKKTAKAD
jgi:DNA-binding transcriptional LysR family regulator